MIYCKMEPKIFPLYWTPYANTMLFVKTNFSYTGEFYHYDILQLWHMQQISILSIYPVYINTNCQGSWKGIKISGIAIHEFLLNRNQHCNTAEYDTSSMLLKTSCITELNPKPSMTCPSYRAVLWPGEPGLGLPCVWADVVFLSCPAISSLVSRSSILGVAPVVQDTIRFISDQMRIEQLTPWPFLLTRRVFYEMKLMVF